MSEITDTLNSDYQDYFLKNPERIIEDLKALNNFLTEHNCTFKGVPMPMLMKPNFISAQQSAILVEYVETMSRALNKFIGLYMSDEKVRKIMGFSDRENELFSIDPGYSNPLVISRLDAFLDGTELNFLEFNCDSPAGIAYSDIMEEGFKELFKSYPFLDPYKIRYQKRQDLLLSTLLECYNEFSQYRKDLPESPVIAIVDWKDVSTYSEFELHQKHFKQNGYDTVIAAPQDFSIRSGHAYVKEQEVHLIYRRVITRELLQKWDEVGEFIRCVREGLVCCCNSFRSYIVGNKKVLSVITDPEFIGAFSEKENELIKNTIPWTRILADEKALFRGEKVDLKSFIPVNKDILVLKPGNMYGGKDVFIGHETNQQDWEDIMNRHLYDDSWVVQEYVNIPVDQYPEIEGSVSFKSKYVNINPFALLNRYIGTITRVSDSLVINVSAGGGLVPTLEAERFE